MQHHGSAAGPAASQHEQSGAGQLRGPAEQHRGLCRGSLPPGRATRWAGNTFDLILSVYFLPRCCISISELAQCCGKVINIDQVCFPAPGGSSALNSLSHVPFVNVTGPVLCSFRDSSTSERTISSSFTECQGALSKLYYSVFPYKIKWKTELKYSGFFFTPKVNAVELNIFPLKNAHKTLIIRTKQNKKTTQYLPKCHLKITKPH